MRVNCDKTHFGLSKIANEFPCSNFQSSFQLVFGLFSEINANFSERGVPLNRIEFE